jgi:hypothetical protein
VKNGVPTYELEVQAQNEVYSDDEKKEAKLPGSKKIDVQYPFILDLGNQVKIGGRSQKNHCQEQPVAHHHHLLWHLDTQHRRTQICVQPLPTVTFHHPSNDPGVPQK